MTSMDGLRGWHQSRRRWREAERMRCLGTWVAGRRRSMKITWRGWAAARCASRSHLITIVTISPSLSVRPWLFVQWSKLLRVSPWSCLCCRLACEHPCDSPRHTAFYCLRQQMEPHVPHVPCSAASCGVMHGPRTSLLLKPITTRNRVTSP